MKKVYTLIFVTCLIFGRVFAAGFPVFDIAAFTNALENLYAQYQSIQNTVEQVQNTYRQIEQATKQMASFDMNEILALGNNFGSGNPFEIVAGVQKTAQDMEKIVKKQINRVNDVKASLTNKSISFGGMNVSVADLCGAGDGTNITGFVKNAWEYTEEATKEAVKAYTEGLTYEEKMAILKKYGISPEDYAKLELANYQMSELVKDSNIAATAEGREATLMAMKDAANALKTISQNAPDGSVVAQAEATVMGISSIIDSTAQLNDTITQIVGLMSSKISSDKASENQKKREEIENDNQKKKDIKKSGAIDEAALSLF